MTTSLKRQTSRHAPRDKRVAVAAPFCPKSHPRLSSFAAPEPCLPWGFGTSTGMNPRETRIRSDSGSGKTAGCPGRVRGEPGTACCRILTVLKISPRIPGRWRRLNGPAPQARQVVFWSSATVQSPIGEPHRKVPYKKFARNTSDRGATGVGRRFALLGSRCGLSELLPIFSSSSLE